MTSNPIITCLACESGELRPGPLLVRCSGCGYGLSRDLFLTLRFEERELAAFEDVGESGQPVTRRFCPKCGSAIVTHVSAAPDLEWIKAGTLDDPSWFEPQMHMWCGSAQPWVSTDDGLPRFEKNPPVGG